MAEKPRSAATLSSHPTISDASTDRGPQRRLLRMITQMGYVRISPLLSHSLSPPNSPFYRMANVTTITVLGPCILALSLLGQPVGSRHCDRSPSNAVAATFWPNIAIDTLTYGTAVTAQPWLSIIDHHLTCPVIMNTNFLYSMSIL
jgi:hypothetical protein